MDLQMNEQKHGPERMKNRCSGCTGWWMDRQMKEQLFCQGSPTPVLKSQHPPTFKNDPLSHLKEMTDLLKGPCRTSWPKYCGHLIQVCMHLQDCGTGVGDPCARQCERKYTLKKKASYSMKRKNPTNSKTKEQSAHLQNMWEGMKRHYFAFHRVHSAEGHQWAHAPTSNSSAVSTHWAQPWVGLWNAQQWTKDDDDNQCKENINVLLMNLQLVINY